MDSMKSEEIEVSVVMPVHNTGIYLEEALESLFAQTFQKFELICVDDFSDDKLTKDILRIFQRRNRNMQLVELENSVGAGEARNIGFSKAQGTYVIFLDADDIFAHDLLEKMYTCISINNADVCVCGYRYFYSENGKMCFGHKYIPDDYDLNCADRDEWLIRVPTAPWNKLCKVQFLKDNDICFQSLKSCNDIFFSCRVILNATKRCCIDDSPLVFYRVQTDTQISANRNPVDLYKAIMSLNEVEGRRVDRNLLLRWSGALLLRNGIMELEKSKNEINNQQFYKLLQRFFREHPIEFRNKILIVDKENVENLTYESNWIHRKMDFLGQLNVTGKLLERELIGKRFLFLWGLGLRGNAFQHFCREHNIDLQGVTDKKNDKIGSKTEYGNKILDTKDVLESKGWIIASNRKIYQELSGKHLKLLNLEEFCPF